LSSKAKQDTPHYRLHRWLAETLAWKELDGCEKAVYVDLALRYRGLGSNNGKISYSIREAAACARVGKTKAAKCLLRLQELGFLVATAIGTFNGINNGRASRWRLTQFACDTTGALASKEFARWRPGDNFHPVKKQSAVRVQVHSVPPSGQWRTRLRTATA
jgi:hypothetical protein